MFEYFPARHIESLIMENNVVIQQQIKVQASRPAAVFSHFSPLLIFDGLNFLAHRANIKRSLENHHEIVEGWSIEAIRSALIDRRARQLPEGFAESRERILYIALALEITANADGNPCHLAATALDHDPDIGRAGNRPTLVDSNLAPRRAEFFEQNIGHPLGEGLNQIGAGFLRISGDSFGDFSVA